jgi:3-deoxy-manno-octulosonate cytidylyltransferase (CMP-KDO synthetase)
MEYNAVRACVIIPARFSSSRFPGKPLVPLLGRPMVLWVAELSALAVGREHVYVATDDKRIATTVRDSGYTALMTSHNTLTGTDRLAEAAEMIDYDIYVNVQGDEPLVDPEDIRRCIKIKADNLKMVVNGFCWISESEDPASINIPKVIATEEGVMVYMSRTLIPGFKEVKNAPSRYMKQVCIYGFTREELAFFAGYGRKSVLEKSEDIEILRFLECSKRIKMFECKPGSLAVDVPGDIVHVEKALLEQMR